MFCVCVCSEAVGGFVGEEQEMCFIQSEKNPSGVPRVCVPFVKKHKIKKSEAGKYCQILLSRPEMSSSALLFPL